LIASAPRLAQPVARRHQRGPRRVQRIRVMPERDGKVAECASLITSERASYTSTEISVAIFV
jgi:hypothetical protein